MSYRTPSSPQEDKTYDGRMHRINLNSCYNLPLDETKVVFGKEIRCWEDLWRATEGNQNRFDGVTPLRLVSLLAEKVQKDLGIPDDQKDTNENYKKTRAIAFKEIESIYRDASEKFPKGSLSNEDYLTFKERVYSPLYETLFGDRKIETNPSVADEISKGEWMRILLAGT
ncbi:MAG: hypothetical protein PVH61_37170 [Candidatus Aminicenantes bacterium]